MRIIQYEGLELEVPDWANFVAGDSDGEVAAFRYKPFICETKNLGVIWCGDEITDEDVLLFPTFLPKRLEPYPLVCLDKSGRKTLAEVEKELSSYYDVISEAERKAQELRETLTVMRGIADE